MDKQRNILRKCLKSIDERSLRKLCAVAMLTDIETNILAHSYSKLHSEDFIADTLFMSVGGIQKKKKIALDKILFLLGLHGRNHYVSEEEIKTKLGILANR